jgi:hypothetical protein
VVDRTMLEMQKLNEYVQTCQVCLSETCPLTSPTREALLVAVRTLL